MKLRTRITVIVSVCLLGLSALLLVEGRTREAAVEDRMADSLVRSLEISWKGLFGAERQRLLRFVSQLRGDAAAMSAALDHDADRLATATAPLQARLRASLRTTHLQAFDRDGLMFFATGPAETGDHPAPALEAGTAREIARQAEPVAGLFRTPDGGVTYALAAPVSGRAGVAGLVVFHTRLADFVRELSDLTGVSTLAFGPGDGLLAASAAPGERLPEIRAAALGSVGSLDTHVIDGRVLRLASIPLEGPYDPALGALAAYVDVTEEAERRALVSRLSYFGLTCVVILFLSFVNWYLRTSFRPLNAVIRSLNALSAGRTDVSVGVPERADEIGQLAGTFETFRQGVEARARLGRLKQELEVAARIQNQCLPQSFPRDPRADFAATMRPAGDVGGDFYDVFELPDGRIGCVIGDVSGKGMGAALFMAISRTVIRSTALLSADPADCLARANDYLCTDNEAMLFVTVFYAVLDPATGEVAYCNAGHNPPVAIAGGRPVLLEPETQPALGVWEEFPYEAGRLSLAAGDRLFFYTDGVTEAMNPTSEEFGETRLLESFEAGSACTCEAGEIVAQVMAAVDAFAEGAAQSDDITCLAVCYRAGSGA